MRGLLELSSHTLSAKKEMKWTNLPQERVIAIWNVTQKSRLRNGLCTSSRVIYAIFLSVLDDSQDRLG